MVEFEVLKSEEIEFGEDELIQIARKRAVSEEGEEEFVSISRGYVDADGKKRLKANISIPLEGDVLRFLADHLPKMEDMD